MADPEWATNLGSRIIGNDVITLSAAQAESDGDLQIQPRSVAISTAWARSIAPSLP
jgi:hypothetical protein